MIKLSVIIPVYNAEKYLIQCIESVLNQSLKEIEVICVDDGSTDSSLEILRDFEARDKRVKVLCQKNGHAGVARNNGMGVATGEYIHFLDSDDYVLNYAYESLYHQAKKNNLDCLKCRCLTYDMQHNVIVREAGHSFKFLKQESINNFLKIDEDSPIYHISVVPWNGIYKREFLEEYQIRFNSLFCVNDRSFFWRVVTNAKRIMLSRDWLVVHRVAQTESLVGKRAEHFDCQFKSMQTTSNQLMVDSISPEICELVMKHEINDLCAWYERLRNNSQYGESICNNTKEFVEEYQGKCSQMLREAYQERMSCVTEKKNNTISKSERVFVGEQFERPKISVIITIYNAEKNLYQCMDSLLNQTMEEIEIICVDNGSDDISEIILNEYAGIDKRVRIIKQQHKLVGVARNNGLKAARGEYVIFIDSNDFVTFQMLEKIYMRARETSADIILFGAKCHDDKNQIYGKKLKYFYQEYVGDKEIFSVNDISDNLFRATTPCMWTKLFKREFIMNEELWVQSLHSENDIYFVFMALCFAERISYVNEELVYHITKIDNILQKTGEKMYLDFYSAYEAVYEELNKRGIYKEVERGFVNTIISECIQNIEALKDDYMKKKAYFYMQTSTFKKMKILDYSGDYYWSAREVSWVKAVNNIFEWQEGFKGNEKETLATSDEKHFSSVYGYFCKYLEMYDEYKKASFESEEDEAYALEGIYSVLLKTRRTYNQLPIEEQQIYYALSIEEMYLFRTLILEGNIEKWRCLEIKLIKVNAELEEVNNKLRKAYEEKKIINCKLQQTYDEKSDINRKLQKTYKEKAERGVEIKKLKGEIKNIKSSKTYKIGKIITYIPRRIKSFFSGRR